MARLVKEPHLLEHLSQIFVMRQVSACEERTSVHGRVILELRKGDCAVERQLFVRGRRVARQ